jgi:AhpC/TSA family
MGGFYRVAAFSLRGPWRAYSFWRVAFIQSKGGIAMRWLATGAMLLLVGLPALWAWDDAKDKPKEPAKSKVAEEVDALIMAHQKAVSDFHKDNNEKIKKAKNDEERSKIYEAFPKSNETMEKLWDLLDMNPKEKDAAITGLSWIVHNSGRDEKGERGRTRAMDLLIKDHADDPNIAPFVGRQVHTPWTKAEELLRAVMEKNRSKDVRGKACLGLGTYLKTVSATVRRMNANPDEIKQMESWIGRETLEQLKVADADKLAKEAQARFEEAVAKYSDVVLYTNAKKDVTVGDSAAGELFEIRNLAIGKEVPEIEGADLEGKAFKLSDYRGKVVVLDFWGNW